MDNLSLAGRGQNKVMLKIRSLLKLEEIIEVSFILFHIFPLKPKNDFKKRNLNIQI